MASGICGGLAHLERLAADIKLQGVHVISRKTLVECYRQRPRPGAAQDEQRRNRVGVRLDCDRLVPVVVGQGAYIGVGFGFGSHKSHSVTARPNRDDAAPQVAGVQRAGRGGRRPVRNHRHRVGLGGDVSAARHLHLDDVVALRQRHLMAVQSPVSASSSVASSRPDSRSTRRNRSSPPSPSPRRRRSPPTPCRSRCPTRRSPGPCRRRSPSARSASRPTMVSVVRRSPPRHGPPFTRHRVGLGGGVRGCHLHLERWRRPPASPDGRHPVRVRASCRPVRSVDTPASPSPRRRSPPSPCRSMVTRSNRRSPSAAQVASDEGVPSSHAVPCP